MHTYALFMTFNHHCFGSRDNSIISYPSFPIHCDKVVEMITISHGHIITKTKIYVESETLVRYKF